MWKLSHISAAMVDANASAADVSAKAMMSKKSVLELGNLLLKKSIQQKFGSKLAKTMLEFDIISQSIMNSQNLH